MTTPLPDIDTEQVAAFWRRAVDAGLLDDATQQPDAEPFGDSVELADELLALVLHGPKRATAASYDEYLSEGDPVPVVGGLSIATDGAGRARALIRTTDVRIGPLSSVDDAFAWDEGEGDRTRASWLADHEAFFRRWLPQVGLVFTDDMPTVFERFEVVYAEP
jgi:uncharacterized protein YhfF